MSDLLRVIGEWLHFLWPLRVVKSYELGVRFIGGKPPKALGPGVYAFLPFFMSIEIVSGAQNVADIWIQRLTTSDGKKIALSFNVTYRVTDAVAHWTNVDDFDQNFHRMAARHCAKKVRENTYDKITNDQTALETSIKKTMQTRVNELGWGCVVDDCGMTDLVEAKPFILINRE